MAVTWRGDEVTKRLQSAAALAIDATMSACIIAARAGHGPGAHGVRRFESHTGELERSFRIREPAHRDARGMVGRWGSRGIVYARRIELGFQGKDARGRTVRAPAYPALRPAAIAEYPKLPRRIKRAFEAFV